jgi:hypothetical protein
VNFFSSSQFFLLAHHNSYYRILASESTLTRCMLHMNSINWILWFVWLVTHKAKKGSLVHVAPACVGFREVSDHFGSCACSFSLHFCKRLFSEFESMTARSQGNSFTTAPRLPFCHPQGYANYSLTSIIH